MVEAGFVGYWNEETSPSPRECLEWSSSNAKPQRLRLINFSAAFLLLAGGCALSFLVFAYENFCRLIRTPHEAK